MEYARLLALDPSAAKAITAHVRSLALARAVRNVSRAEDAYQQMEGPNANSQ